MSVSPLPQGGARLYLNTGSGQADVQPSASTSSERQARVAGALPSYGRMEARHVRGVLEEASGLTAKVSGATIPGVSLLDDKKGLLARLEKLDRERSVILAQLTILEDAAAAMA